MVLLLRHGFESKGGSSFYDFVPYQFGPFSFSLYQEADKLVAQGYLREQGGTWTLNDKLAQTIPAPGAAFLNRLVVTGILRLVDVRNNPIARRYGFHKSTLTRLTDRLGIKYVHIPELGIHSKKRQDLDSQASYDLLFDEYETTTLESEEQAMRRVSSLVAEAPSVLVCMEADPACCHRSRLAQRVSAVTELPIVHLQE